MPSLQPSRCNAVHILPNCSCWDQRRTYLAKTTLGLRDKLWRAGRVESHGHRDSRALERASTLVGIKVTFAVRKQLKIERLADQKAVPIRRLDQSPRFGQKDVGPMADMNEIAGTLKVCIAANQLNVLTQTEKMMKRFRGAKVDILDRLPTSFGLIRSGVAPDHPETKALERSSIPASRPSLRFVWRHDVNGICANGARKNDGVNGPLEINPHGKVATRNKKWSLAQTSLGLGGSE